MKPLKPIGMTLLLLSVCLGWHAAPCNAGNIAEDRGTGGILAALDKLPVCVRVLETIAHPDDESAGTLTWLSRKYHATTALFCLTRGEGGQNILGTEKYEALGLVRTGELLEACRYYGADLFFGNNVDFGFSKTAEETFSKWGHAAALEEMVRFIRRWRPSIILSRFGGTPADGHGHHQATGKLTLEAYRAAADPAMFPEHLKRGLQPWQANKLYISSRSREPAEGRPVVRVPSGDYDPVLGRSYIEIASEGYSRHRTQGMGMFFSLPGSADEFFQLYDPVADASRGEDGLFDGFDTSLMAIYDLAGTEKESIPFLKQDLSGVMEAANEARKAFRAIQPELSAPAVAGGIRILNRSLQRIETVPLSEPIKAQLKDALEEKLSDFQNALNAVLGIELIAVSSDMTGIPGSQPIPVTIHFYNRGTKSVDLKQIELSGPSFMNIYDGNNQLGIIPPGSGTMHKIGFRIAEYADITEPFWYLENTHDARYRSRPTEDNLAPFSKPPFQVEAIYQFEDAEIVIHAPVRADAGDPVHGTDFEDFQVVPALSVALEPGFIIAPVEPDAGSVQLRVSVINSRDSESEGTVKLQLGNEWTVQPAESPFTLLRKGEIHTATFTVEIPTGTEAGEYSIKVVADMGGRKYNLRQHTISYPDNWTRFLYDSVQSTLRIFDLKTAPDLTVGYIPGAGDEIPMALEQIGIPVQVLAASDLAFGNLDRFPAIITGIRAYNVNEALQANNRRLLEYVANGGTLIVQYVQPTERPFEYGPYPMNVSRTDRITVEEAPIDILVPDHPVFNWPNKITDADFNGWVQERGLYFMNSWDGRYTPLLSGSDPGEEAKNGGMLLAQYGKGYYVYSAYSWFRQLPAGVPGAYRIFVNMISLGSEPN